MYVSMFVVPACSVVRKINNIIKTWRRKQRKKTKQKQKQNKTKQKTK